MKINCGMSLADGVIHRTQRNTQSNNQMWLGARGRLCNRVEVFYSLRNKEWLFGKTLNPLNLRNMNLRNILLGGIIY